MPREYKGQPHIFKARFFNFSPEHDDGLGLNWNSCERAKLIFFFLHENLVVSGD